MSLNLSEADSYAKNRKQTQIKSLSRNKSFLVHLPEPTAAQGYHSRISWKSDITRLTASLRKGAEALPICPTIIEASNMVSLTVVGNSSRHQMYKICQHVDTLSLPIIVSVMISHDIPTGIKSNLI